MNQVTILSHLDDSTLKFLVPLISMKICKARVTLKVLKNYCVLRQPAFNVLVRHGKHTGHDSFLRMIINTAVVGTIKSSVFPLCVHPFRQLCRRGLSGVSSVSISVSVSYILNSTTYNL